MNTANTNDAVHLTGTIYIDGRGNSRDLLEKPSGRLTDIDTGETYRIVEVLEFRQFGSVEVTVYAVRRARTSQQ